MKTLRLYLCPLAELGADSPLDFERLDDKRAVMERGRAVLADLPRGARVELVIAAPDVLLVEVGLPPLSGARLRAALPALAEPHVLGDIESAYVVAARIPGGPKAMLAVLDRALLARALELLRRAKLDASSATPAQLALPLRPNHWSFRQGALRTGPLRGIACSAGAPPVELQLALEQAGSARPAAIDVEGEVDVAAWSAALAVPVEPVEAGVRAEPVALELLQYEFAPGLASWSAWRVPVALAALCLLTSVVGLNVDAWFLRREERALREHMEATLRDAFPGTSVVLDPVKQMRRGVAELRAAAGTADPRDFLALAAALARALPTERDVVRALEFRDQTLRVDFEPKALEAPKKREAMVDSASAAGLSARFSEASLSVRAKGDTP